MYKSKNPDIMKGLRYMKKLWILAVASAVLLTGCASEQTKAQSGAAAGGVPEADMNSVPAITEIAIEEPAIAEGEAQPPEKLTAPPNVMICTTTEMIASAAFMTKGTYSWSYEESDGIMASVEADCVLPGEMEDVNAVIALDGLTGAPEIQVPTGARIVKVECWSGTATQSVDFDENGKIMFPEEPIGNTYCVTIEFDGTGFSYGEQGTCDYVFRTADNVSDNTDSDGENNTESVPPVTAQSSAGFNPEEVVQLPGHIVSDPPQYTQTPPELTAFFVENDEKIEFELATGTYMWTYYDDNGNLTTVCADMAINHQQGLPRDFSTDTEIVFVNIPEGAAIADVICFAEDGTEQSVNCANDMIIFRDKPIGEVYCVTMKFENGSYCEYWFAAECGETEYNEPLQGALAPIAPEYDVDDLYKPEGRISRINWDERYAPTAMIRSLDELKTYYTAHLANEWTAFEDCFAEYSSAFFEKNVLVISYFDEGSGSISHEYLGIDNENGCVVVRRTTPEVGTDDMAAYVLTVEIPADKALESYSIVFDNVYEWDYE